jgi:polyphosphate glucokinase
MELAHMNFKKGKTYEAYSGDQGRRRLGPKKWQRAVTDIVDQLRKALEADYVVLGGGNARKLKKLPKGARLGNNDFAFLGGFRMWRPGGIGKRR